MERHVGLDNVGAFHLNDSKKPLGSRVDRHQHIGEGELGLEPFRFLLNDPRFARIPKVIETPKTDRDESAIGGTWRAAVADRRVAKAQSRKVSRGRQRSL